jgi:pimeloyl-ACP methyl ester carboxylesterase
LFSLLAWILAFAALAALLGAIYQASGSRKDARLYPPPGRLVDIGTHRLHLLESGRPGSAPTLVLEAGLMSTVLSWSNLQQELCKSFHVVSYDRAGLGWSDLGPMPRTADRIVDELHALLEKAAIRPPYILVGHSFGGLTMPVFATRFPNEVVGVVLVDPVAPSEWSPPPDHDLKQTRIGAKVCRRSAILARIGVPRLIATLLTTRARNVAARLVRLISRGTPGNAGTVSSPWFAALPKNEQAMAAVFWIQPKFALTIASQLENLPVSATSGAQLPNDYDKPVVILSASTASERRRNGHAAMARLLPLGTHIQAANSNHWIMQEETHLVLSAIQEVVSRAQKTAQSNGQSPLAAKSHAATL